MLPITSTTVSERVPASGSPARLYRRLLMFLAPYLGIGAVLAGIVFIVVTHTATDLVLEALGIFPPPKEGLHITGWS